MPPCTHSRYKQECECLCMWSACQRPSVAMVTLGKRTRRTRRDLGKERVHSRPLGDSYSLAPFLFHDFPSFHVTHILKSFCVSFFIFSQPPFINISRAFFYLGRNNACTETTCHYDRINLTIVNILVSKGPNNA